MRSLVRVKLKEEILRSEKRLAAANRRRLRRAGIPALNLIGSPGAGKTSLIEAIVGRLGKGVDIGVIEGDLASDKDARRLRALGVRALQINTGRGCHLSPGMIASALKEMPLREIDLLLIENVGNLVCPANFDLGEDAKVAITSVAEGDDKPAKYPLLFLEAAVAILNKIDLMPVCDFSRRRFYRELRIVNPDLKVIEVSCRTGAGVAAWVRWLRGRLKERKI